MNNLVPLSILNSILWALYGHIDKKILKVINYKELYITRNVYKVILLLVLFGILALYGKYRISSIKMDIDTKWYIWLTIVIGVISILVELYTFQYNKISTSVGVMGGLYIVSTVLLGKYIFRERLNRDEYIGIMVIVAGVYMIGKSKN